MLKSFKTIKFRTQRGFSLVELAAVLTIIGVTLAGALDLATRKTESDRVTETNTKMDTIETALQLFLINNQRLPCPADATIPLNSANAGIEVNSTPTAGCTGSNFNNGAYVYSGTVPTKTLGIPDSNMSDGWDRRMDYVVDYRFANNSSCSSTSGAQLCFKNTTISSTAGSSKDQTSLQVFDSLANDPTHVNPRTTAAVYVLISHGKNGYGAFTYAGSATRLAASSDTDEKDNAGTDKTNPIDAIFVQADTSTTFDDIVRYKTKTLLIDGINGVTDSTTCNAALDTVTNSGTHTDATCPNATASSETNCDSLATQVNKFCLQ